MKNRIKNMSRGGYIVIGFLVAMLLVPSGVAVAKALKYTGIAGSNGAQVFVNGFGSLQVDSEPAVFQSGQINPGSSWTLVVSGGQNEPSDITSLSVDTWAVTPGINDAIQFGLSSNSCSTVYKTISAVNPGAIGYTAVDVGAGVEVQGSNGYALCAINDDTTNLHAAVFAMYTIRD